jgi:hypothetical protein
MTEHQWQPIETAPKKGEYLVYQPDFKLGRNVLSARICFVSQAGDVRTTTHWLPLPAPPKG